MTAAVPPFTRPSTTSTFIVLLSLICWTSNAMLLRDSSRRLPGGSRYFTREGMLPPLSSALAAVYPTNQTMTIPYSSASIMNDADNSECQSIPVTYTNNPRAVCDWLTKHVPADGCILGFDVEARPNHIPAHQLRYRQSYFHQAATVQLATPDAALVVHLVQPSGKHSSACAPILKAVLCDDQIVKAGCALDDDLMSLHEIWGDLDAKCRLDLGLIGSSQNQNNRLGLKRLSKGVLGVDLRKCKSIAQSDWSVVPLTENQVIYSARDAWAGAAIANQLAKEYPDIFGHETLLQAFQDSEIPISELVRRQQRRTKAKRKLRELVRAHKYKGSRRNLPEPVFEKMKHLQKIVKQRVVEPTIVLEMDHFDIH